MLNLPAGALFLLSRLTARGHQAYVVGGCVRDSLLGYTPKDWDVCTSATPEEMKLAFAGLRVVETGLQHGTLTVVIDRVPYEVTTFRVDGTYTDHRHPDSVTFVRDVRDDLSRRDFTVNAMAYSPETGLVDAFGGQEDLRRRLIRCVGEPAARFQEDALRILRALRFASVYGFALDDGTARAIRMLYPTLQDVAAERIRVELDKLLCGPGAEDILRAYPEVITFLLPEMKPCVGFEQRTAYHRFDVWEHSVRAVACVPPAPVLRLTMLLHDSGKPACFTVDAAGIGHATGHPKVSRALAEQALTRLKYDNATRDRVLTLVACHDMPLDADPKLLTRRLHQLGEEALRQLIEVHRADNLAKGTAAPPAVEGWYHHVLQALDNLLAQKPCFTLRDMAVRGNDLAALGFPPGPAMGACLNDLLEQVMCGDVPNERGALLLQALFWRQQHTTGENAGGTAT